MRDLFGFKADSNRSKLYCKDENSKAAAFHHCAQALAVACLVILSIAAMPSLLTPKTTLAESLYSTLTINSVSTSGSSFAGYFGLWQSGTFLSWNTGTSITYTLRSGLTYTITPVSYGGYVFDHWSDSSSSSRSIAINSDTTLTAVYRVPEATNNNSAVSTAPTTSTLPAASVRPAGTVTASLPTSSSACVQSTVASATPSILPTMIVKSVNTANQAISGYFGLWQSGTFLSWNTGTSITYTLRSGLTYTITPVSYGGYVFDHWSDSSSSSRSIAINSDTTLTAVYRSSSEPPTACAPNPSAPASAASTPVSTTTTSSIPTPSTTSTIPPPTTFVSASSGSLVKVSSGLQEYDSLTNGNYDSGQLVGNNPNGWFYFGSGPSQGAPYSYSMDTSSGLKLGVQALSPGQWAGLYAVTPSEPSNLYHAVLSLGSSSLGDNSFNTGLYVQTANGLINYVTCVGSLTPSGPVWAVVRTTGNTVQATSFETLWINTSPGQPTSRDCTIITNGSNFLQVYLDGSLVYSSSSLDLQMPAPFNAYLEVQSSTPSGMLFSTYNDYYSTSNQYITVTNAPAGDIVKVVGSDSHLISSATVGSGGSAQVDVGAYHMPLAGSVVVYGPDGNKIVASTGSGSLFAGDVYSMSGT